MGRAEIKRFRRDAEEVAAFLRPRLDGKIRVKVISHTDADGIASAAIMARCLYAYNIPFTVKLGRPPSEEDIGQLGAESHDLYIFLDQGSGQMDVINKHLLARGKEVVIIDHHPGPLIDHPRLSFLNPHTCGLSGSIDVSASGATFSVVEQLDLRFRSLLGLAIVGAIGDRQESPFGFTGVNDTLLKRSVDLGLVRESEGLKLTRRSLVPVVECLRTSVRPYLIGLSGNPSSCRSLVDSLEISHSRLISELGSDAEKKLAEAIVYKVGAQASREEFRNTLWGTILTATTDDLVGPKELGEYAALIDACGNMRNPEIGFALATGDGNYQRDALGLLGAYQEQMLRAMEWLVDKLASFKLASNFRYIYAGNDIDSAILGEMISLAIESALIPVEQPVVGMADTVDGFVKVSARATPALVAAGVNLGQAISRAAAAVGGYGGGHDVSAAARIPRNRLEDFVAELDRAMTGWGR
ncbi:MAG: DHH family phosphoesterase [Candidatus Hadarchaeum sp.]|uniref:DHH family phosphoesterase n=1 Tax=Candidatus Hadarchaeum sp. TaxID=2883567 RepID=UPI003D0FFE5C